jgi:twitching motility protein PilI
MANREALRQLQTRLAERMQAAREQAPEQSWLAVECAGHGFLLPLAQAGEIFPLQPLLTVPHTKPWFLGVANLRGSLHGVVDLAAFFRMRRSAGEAARDPSRLVAFNAALEVNGALLVDRLAGLRSFGQLQGETAAANETPAFAGARYRDGEGRPWQELNLQALTRDEQFLRIVG